MCYAMYCGNVWLAQCTVGIPFFIPSLHRSHRPPVLRASRYEGRAGLEGVQWLSVAMGKARPEHAINIAESEGRAHEAADNEIAGA